MQLQNQVLRPLLSHQLSQHGLTERINMESAAVVVGDRTHFIGTGDWTSAALRSSVPQRGLQWPGLLEWWLRWSHGMNEWIHSFIPWDHLSHHSKRPGHWRPLCGTDDLRAALVQSPVPMKWVLSPTTTAALSMLMRSVRPCCESWCESKGRRTWFWSCMC